MASEESIDDKSDPMMGWPGVETYSLDEFSSVQVSVSFAFRELGLSWQHPRVLAFLARVEEKVGVAVRSRHQLPFVYYRQLAEKLTHELGLRAKGLQ